MEKYNFLLSLSVIESLDADFFNFINSIQPDKRENIINAYSVLNPDKNLPKKNVVCESYPKLNSEIAAKIVLGVKVGEGLTKKERHQWLSEGANKSPIEFLLRGTGLEARHIKVARWLLKMLKSKEQKEALYKIRREGKLADHTIDLIPSDCTRGVREAIARRADRMAVQEYGAEKLCNTPKWLKSLGGRVSILDTAPALEREGREMSHCVGGYARQVNSGSSIIVSIKAWGHRATIEYNSINHSIIQAKGKANSKPSKLCMRLAELAVKKPHG